jgi:hypothetical protein
VGHPPNQIPVFLRPLETRERTKEGDLFMSDSNFRPYIYLFIGIFLMGLGVASTLSGEALGRFGRTASRFKEPMKFWGLVSIDYLGGAFGIGYFLYQKYLAK